PERHVWQGEVGKVAHPWLGDHQLHDAPALPGAAFCEMASAAARTVFGTASEICDVRFEQMLLLDDETAVGAAATVKSPGVAAFEVETYDDGERVRRATAILRSINDEDQPVSRDVTDLLAAHPCEVEGADLRDWMLKRGIHYGPAFAGLVKVH